MDQQKKTTYHPQQLTRHQKLERRRLLNADFNLIGGQFELSNFVDTSSDPNLVTFSQSASAPEIYQVSLADGVFNFGGTGAVPSGITGDGTNLLTLDTDVSAITSILASSTTGDSFDIEFGTSFDFTGDITIEQSGGGVNFGTISQQMGAEFTHLGTLDITGVDEVNLNEADNDFDNVRIEATDNITLVDTDDIDLEAVQSAMGAVDVMAGGNVQVDGAVDAGTSIDINASAGNVQVDGFVDAGTSIDIDASAGNVQVDDSITANGTVDIDAGGDIDLLSVTSFGDAVDLMAGGNVQVDGFVSASGTVDIDAGGDIDLLNAQSGGDAVDLMAASNVTVGAVTAFTTIDVTAGGSILDSDNDLAVDFTAGGQITLLAVDDVGGSVVSGDQKLEFAAGSVVDATSDTGNVELRGLGDITLVDVEATAGAVDVMAAGDVTVGSVTAGTTVDVTAGGSINDSDDDLAVDFTAGGQITLSANAEVGGEVPSGSSVDADEKLEFAAGSVVDATSTTGNVELRGLGDITLVDVEATAGAVDVMAAGDVIVGDVTAVDNVDITSENGDIIMSDSSAINAAGGEITLTAEGDITLGSLTTTNSETAVTIITNTGSVLDGGDTSVDISAVNGDVVIRSGDNVGLEGAVDFFKVDAASIDAIEVSSSRLDIEAAGSIAINQLNPMSEIVNFQASTAFFNSDGDLEISDAAPTVTNLALFVGGTLSLPSTLTVAGNLRIESDAILADDGSIDLTSMNGEVLVRSSNSLTINSIDADNGTANVISDDDVTLTGSLEAENVFVGAGADGTGTITLDGNIAADQVSLQSSNGVTQDSGIIATDDLLLSGGGSFDLTANNSFSNLAADIDGDLDIINDSAINITDLSFTSASDCIEVTISGVNVDAAGSLAGDFNATTTNADITQDAAVTVEGTTTLDAGTGDIILNGADRSVERTGSSEDTTDCTTTGHGQNDNDFGRIVADGSTVEIVDVNDLEVGGITAVEDVFLRAGDTGLSSGTLTLDGNVTTSDPAGQVLLQSDGGVTQDSGGVTTNELLLGGDDLSEEGAGAFNLNGPNQVNVLAASLDDSLLFTNTTDLKIDSVDYLSDAGTSETHAGITTSNDDVNLLVDGNLTIQQTIDLGTGDLLLDVEGDASQIATGTIDAGGLALQVEGVTVLNVNNDIGVLAVDNNGATQVNTSNDLKIGEVDANGVTITGVTTSDDDVKLTAGGNLTLEAASVLGEGDLFLDVDGDVSQIAAGTIDAAGLGLQVDGETILNESNDVDFLAVNNNGATQFTDINDLKVGTVTIEAVSADRAMLDMNGMIETDEVSLVGVTTSNDDVKLTADGNLTLEAASVLGEGDLFLDVDGDVSQIAAGTINAAGLGLQVDGETILNESNDIDFLAANNNGATQFTDINDLKVGAVTILSLIHI